jgi:hypothetical protein
VPYKAVVEEDREWLGAILDHVPELVQGMSEAFAGITTDEFEEQVQDFFRTAAHPALGLPYSKVTYEPMLQLLRYLEANEFEVFICSGGGRDFVRAVSLARFALLVRHDDAQREFDYDAGAERALSVAGANGWTVASIQDDFASVF